MPAPRQLLLDAVRLIRQHSQPLFLTYEPAGVPYLVLDSDTTWLIGVQPQEDGWQDTQHG